MPLRVRTGSRQHKALGVPSRRPDRVSLRGVAREWVLVERDVSRAWRAAAAAMARGLILEEQLELEPRPSFVDRASTFLTEPREGHGEVEASSVVPDVLDQNRGRVEGQLCRHRGAIALSAVAGARCV